ncbi:MAG: hypothetical protein AVDCRST_MAG36-1167 [uncultured Nocardioidaceae bacterium]|uniref:Polyketide cyclase/dehydrase n=1 Tax=uncultured Nocardioidaceae bacterium TaxID=253824 RepID=A0A6J4LL61_9ACTN|nr:MAG: hypothetical protein AVDCRST_MAG36-1167 [uncultured Nocardioidaceae bacterium]
MAVNERTIHASPEAVWQVLSDGWLYPVWVVGATRMRDVDATWPAPGSRLHHSAGVWPVIVNDETRVESVEPLRRVQLRAKGWPLGEADVVIELEPAGDRTVVRISEDAATGPGRLVPGVVRAPVMKWRNSETLRRLAFLCEGRVEGREPREAHGD